MISIYQLKPKFQTLLQPLLAFLHKKKVTANQITVAAVFWSGCIGVCFWFGESHSWLFLALPVGLFVRMALNALDGMMARNYQQQTKKGEILNELGDVVSDFFIFFPFLKYENQHIYLIVCFIALSIINEFAGVMGKIVSGERRYDGPMGKSDRALLVALYGILCFLGIKIGASGLYIYIALLALLLLSTYSRLSNALK